MTKDQVLDANTAAIARLEEMMKNLITRQEQMAEDIANISLRNGENQKQPTDVEEKNGEVNPRNQGQITPKAVHNEEKNKFEWDDLQFNEMPQLEQKQNLEDVHKKEVDEKLSQMEVLLKKLKKLDDVVDVQAMSLFPNARLPPKFKMPEMDKFDGTTCPKTHLKMYVRAMHPLGVNDEILAQLFQRTLTGAALKWFLSLEDSRVRTWEDICSEFVKHYKYNTEVDVTRRDLELTRQGQNELFSTYVARWRAKAAQMTNRPNEEEQIQIIMKNLAPSYSKHLFAQYFHTFKSLIGATTQVEDALSSGTLKNETSSNSKWQPPNKKTQEVNVVARGQTPFQLTRDDAPKRQFTNLGMPINRVYEKLKGKGLLQPLTPRAAPDPLPPWYDVNAHCDYHQGGGHQTNKCMALRHAIEDLIRDKVIKPPAAADAPNVNTNPLPNHAALEGRK